MHEAATSAAATLATAPSATLRSLLSLRAHVASTLFTSHVYYHLIETLFFLLIIYLAFTRAYKPWTTRHPSASFTPAERAAKLAAWRPAPLNAAPVSPTASASAPAASAVSPASARRAHVATAAGAPPEPTDVEIVSDGAGPLLTLRGHKRPAINVATANFLGLLKHPRVEEAALATMQSYGCGACGPRGFYGTTDVHLECEDALARFCNTPSAILYSFGSATANSTIPAFIKRADLVVIDVELSPILRLGVDLSRARTLAFAHNDMRDLRRVLQHAVKNDEMRPDLPRTQRRLIIAEGISAAAGDVCPLDQVVKLKDEFGFRLLLDESLSLGVLGRTGRGALEEFHVPRSSVEIATADLGNALATVGGFCVGNDDVVDHQRLSGAGYCFSASQPPFLAKAATTALSIVENEGADLVKTLRQRIATFHANLDHTTLRRAGWLVSTVDARSPIIHFRRRAVSASLHDDARLCVLVHKLCLENDVVVSLPPPHPPQKHTTGSSPQEAGDLAPDMSRRPSVRVTISAALSDELAHRAACVVQDALVAAADATGRDHQASDKCD